LPHEISCDSDIRRKLFRLMKSASLPPHADTPIMRLRSTSQGI
jgi:hypothetical protein